MSNRMWIVMATVCLLSVDAQAADVSPLIGKWKLNAAKSVLAGFPMKIEDAGNHQFKVISGDDVETLVVDGRGTF